MTDAIGVVETNAQISPARRTARGIWLSIHRWLGITMGLPLAIIGLTGSLVVLTGTFIGLQHGDTLKAPEVAQSSHQLPAKWLAATQQEFGDDFHIAAIAAPHKSPLASSAALVIGSTHEGPDGENHKVVALDPATSKIRGSFDLEKTYGFIPVGIHTSLMIPLIGLDIVAIIGIISLLSIVSGMVLWWPKPGQWVRAITIAAKARGLLKLQNLHNVIAIYVTLFLLILSATGVWMLKPEWVDPAVSVVSKVRPAPTSSEQSASCAGVLGGPTSIETAMSLAQARFPDRTFAFVLTPEDDVQHYEVTFSTPRDMNPRDGDTSVFVASACPKIISVTDQTNLTVSERAKKLSVALHSGHAAGPVGVTAVFLSGLALPTLYITGMILWWKKRRNRRAMARV